VNPDNVAVGHDTIMVQEDASSNPTLNDIWAYSLGSDTWTKLATVVDSEAETSGVVDMSAWIGPGWWAFDVQRHGVHDSWYPDDTTYFTWTGGPTPPGGNQYRVHREEGQLLLLYVPGS
jgi:hypothetical protein